MSKTIDLVKILKPHKDKWVALSRDHRKVLGAGDTLSAAKKQAEKKSKDFIFIKLPPPGVNYIPTTS